MSQLRWFRDLTRMPPSVLCVPPEELDEMAALTWAYLLKAAAATSWICTRKWMEGWMIVTAWINTFLKSPKYLYHNPDDFALKDGLGVGTSLAGCNCNSDFFHFRFFDSCLTSWLIDVASSTMLPCLKANLEALFLIRRLERFMGLVCNWLLYFQDAVSVDFPSSSLVWHNHDWWISNGKHLWCAAEPQERGHRGPYIQYVCFFKGCT